MSFMVKDLIEGCPLPVCVKPTNAVQDALAKMIAKDYSQLPVVKDDLVPEGLPCTDGAAYIGMVTAHRKLDSAIVRGYRGSP